MMELYTHSTIHLHGVVLNEAWEKVVLTFTEVAQQILAHIFYRSKIA
jgi:hypothetical protein